MRGDLICDYSAEITDTGQTDAQEPHLMQPSAITLIIRTSIKI